MVSTPFQMRPKLLPWPRRHPGVRLQSASACSLLTRQALHPRPLQWEPPNPLSLAFSSHSYLPRPSWHRAFCRCCFCCLGGSNFKVISLTPPTCRSHWSLCPRAAFLDHAKSLPWLWACRQTTVCPTFGYTCHRALAHSLCDYQYLSSQLAKGPWRQV